MQSWLHEARYECDLPGSSAFRPELEFDFGLGKAGDHARPHTVDVCSVSVANANQSSEGSSM